MAQDPNFQELVDYFTRINKGLIDESPKLEPDIQNNLAVYLRYLHISFSYRSQTLLIKIFPRVRVPSDLISLQIYLRSQIQNRKFDELPQDFYLTRIQKIYFGQHPSQFAYPTIQIKVKRKSPPAFCFGNKCFKLGKRYLISELFSIKCCQFHTYCKPCIQEYIRNSLINNPYDAIRCEACKEIGTVNLADDRAVITRQEIELLTTQAERTNFFQEEARRRFLTKCEGRSGSCPYKDKFIEVNKIMTLECGERFCKECYFEFIIRFIFEESTCIINSPEAFMNYPIIGIMCPNRHPSTMKRYSAIDLGKILANSEAITRSRIEQALSYYNYFEKFFLGFPTEYCKACKHIAIKDDLNNTTCTKCSLCLYCSNGKHPGIDCERFKLLELNFGNIGNMKTGMCEPGNPDTHLVAKAIEILKNLGLTSHRIDFYKTVEPPGMLKYKYEILQQKYSNLKATYMLSKAYTNMNDVDDLFYNGLKADENQACELFVSLKAMPDNFWAMIYRTSFLGDAIQRTPSAADVSEEPKLYRSGDKAFITVIESAFPFLIVNLAKIA